MRKILIYIKLYWLRGVLIAIVLGMFTLIVTLLTLGFHNFALMESFARKQMAAMMGMYLIMGIVQAFVFVSFIQLGNYYFMRGGLLGRLGQEKFGTAQAKVKWDEVIGMEQAKSEALELVRLLKDKDLIKQVGGKIIKGTLMVGPPGCGKTYLAKAISTECGLPMISSNGSNFVGMFVGQGAAQMRSVFKQARAQAELHGGCILFIDEIDSFARPRMADTGFGGGISHNATINQFLTEMDGLRKRENNIVVIAATNVSEDQLDDAIVRSGRFDRKIHVQRPNLKEREELIKFYLGRIKTDDTPNPAVLAQRSVYFSSADIDAMVREAGVIALKDRRSAVNMKDMSEAYDRIAFGDKTNLLCTDEDLEWTSYHETGHAIIAFLLHPKDDVVKATIIPRKGMLGFVSHLPAQESHGANKEELLARIKISVASYVAEKVKFGTTGQGVGGSPSADFSRAMATARHMVWSLGMGQSGLIGDFKNYSMLQHAFPLSQKTLETLEADAQDILQTCMNEVESLLTKHNDLFEHFAQELLKKKELEYDEIQKIFDQYNVKPLSGRVPFRTPEEI